MIIKVKINPNSGKQEVVKSSEKGFVVYVKKPAQEGKANLELIKLLQRYFKKKIKIKSGFTSRNKIVEVVG